MSGGCNYTVGNVAFSPSFGGMCGCFCHRPMAIVGGWHQCWCMCNKYQSPQLPIENIGVLRETLDKLEARIIDIEKWRKGVKILCDQSKKPHKCPVCDGLGGTMISGVVDENCNSCQGKGIVWG